jgi:hypothetical protein
MGLTDTLRERIYNWLIPGSLEDQERLMMLRAYEKRREYREGVQRQNLKVKPFQADDNLTLNFTGLIVDRGIAMLMGEGLDFDFPGDDENDPRAQYIDAMIEANVYPIFLHKIAQLGGTYGTTYVKILPGALPGGLPRLVPINPQWIMPTSLPDDMDTVFRYTIQYNAEDEETEKMVAYKEVTEHLRTVEGFADSWSVKNYVARENTGGRWELVSDVLWPHEFPPIIHWQNLPNAEEVLGDPDITDDMIAIQDGLNFVASNVQRIIRYHAHPKTWGKGANLGNTTSWGADEVVMFNDPNSILSNLEMQSDLASSREFLHYLRGVLFDISRTVDISSMTDKLGALTNFGLRVLYKDALDKLKSKRELYGWGLSEINRRCLILAGIATDTGGEVVWPEPLPTNLIEQAQALQIEMGLGLVDKQTAATELGYDWEVISERLAEEQQGATNLGDQLLRAFEQGQGGSTTGQQPAQLQQVQQGADQMAQ